ncbi:flagellar hook capping FlgD N-terminal domain-containing protein, partial [Yersinia enterocolitica]
MAVSPVMSSSNTSANESKSGGNSVEDLTDSFMTLLVAQMQNQDPTNPMDNNQLTSQLAQFNTASGVQQLNTTLNAVGSLVTSMQQMNAADWVGRRVWIEGDSV